MENVFAEQMLVEAETAVKQMGETALAQHVVIIIERQ